MPKDERNRIVPVRGDLRVQEAAAEAMGRRLCRVATLHALDRAIDDHLLPPLHDVALLWVAPLGMVLGGIEFDGQGAFWQTWHLTSWDRSAPVVVGPRHVAAHEAAGYCRDAGGPPALNSSSALQVAPLAEPICRHEDSTAHFASASNTVVGEKQLDLRRLSPETVDNSVGKPLLRESSG
ncbi:hypothetical protein [Azohydromonas australica]|uniref:hypothetical protein n=1 Tax=Azohydromonas australica TaxID=364039 RepID=UPI00040D210D|nr:hypothetical protein [Azohydromonas australica]